MARFGRTPTVDPAAFQKWGDRVARYLRVPTSDNPRHARDMSLIASEVEAARSPAAVLALDLPGWVACEARELLDP